MKKNMIFKSLSVFLLFLFQANAQFDGWQNFTNTTPITSLADNGQEIIVGTSGGIVKINKTTGNKTVLTKANDKLFSIDITSLLVDKNKQLWLGTTQGFSKEGVDTAIFKKVVDSTFLSIFYSRYNCSINSLTLRQNGDFILGMQMGLAIFDGQKTRIFRYTAMNWKEFFGNNSPYWTGGCDYGDPPQNWVNCTVSDSLNFLWAGTQKGLFKTDFSTWTSFDTVNSKLPSNQITCLAIVDSKSLWVGTSKGLAQLKSNAWQTINAPNYNLSDSIRCLFVDSQKRLWLVNSLGLVQAISGNWSLADGSAIAKNICAIMEDAQGAIWAATDTALYIYSNKQLQLFASLNNTGISSNSGYTNFVEDSKGNIWFGYSCWQPINSGIANFNGNSWSGNLISSQSASVRALCVDNNKSVWAATDKGIMHFSENTPSIFTKANSEIPSDNIYSIICDSKGTVWAGADSCLLSFSGGQWVNHSTGLSTKYIAGLFCDKKNNIWAWTGVTNQIGPVGLAYFDGNEWKNPLLNSPYMQIANMMSDSSGNIWVWVDSYSGVICWEFDYTLLIKFDGQQWTNFTTDSMHLPCNRIYSLTVDTTGVVWAGTCGGSAAFINNSWKFYDANSLNLPFHKPTPDFIDSKHNYWIAQSGDGIFFKKNTTGILINKNNRASIQNQGSLLISQNKANHSITIKYGLKSPGNASISIFDLQGKLQWSMAKWHSSSGSFLCSWNGKTASGNKIQAGVYFVRFRNANCVSNAKITIPE
jgi:hypothetical protein